MNIGLSKQVEEDIVYWNKTDPKKAARILSLLENIMETPFSGLGRPEPLKHGLQGYWSRRIDHEHRLVYKVTEEVLIVASCRFHYE